MKIKLPAYLFYFIVSVQHGLSQADSTLTQDINPATYPDPFSVSVQNQQLQMAYMDVLPGKPNGNAVVLLHGKKIAGRITQHKIKGSKLVSLANTGHLPHIESFEKFINTLTLFLKPPDKSKV